MLQQQKNRATDQLIALGVANIEKDRVIWKMYSEQGGLYDLLNSFHLSVLKPTVNAMDYDEEENTYVICITLYNAIYLRMKRNLEKLHQELNKAEQSGRDYVPATRKRSITKEKSLNRQETLRFEGKFIKCLKSIDHWLMRLRFYKKIRCAIVNDKASTRAVSVPFTETIEIYEEDELSKASYQMRYSELLQIIKKIVDEMGKQLTPLHEKNESFLSQYMGRASAVNEMIKTELFSHEEWVL